MSESGTLREEQAGCFIADLPVPEEDLSDEPAKKKRYGDIQRTKENR
jgi:hypothetical protein